MQIPEAKLGAWVRRYGASSNSYVLLEGPKSYFTLPGVDGFLGYQVSAGVQSKRVGIILKAVNRSSIRISIADFRCRKWLIKATTN